MGVLAIVNPRRRKRRKSRKARRAPSHRRIRRSRRRRSFNAALNPRKKRRVRRSRRSRGFLKGLTGGSSGAVGLAKSTVKTAAYAAGGALLLDIVWGYAGALLPAAVQTGYVRHVAKAAGAVAVGLVAQKFLGRKTGELVALGAMTVVLHNVMREVTAQFIPGVALAGYEDIEALSYLSPGQNVGEYQMGEQMNGIADDARSEFDTADMA